MNAKLLLTLATISLFLSSCGTDNTETQELQIPNTEPIARLFPVNYNDVPQPLYSPMSMFNEKDFYTKHFEARYWSYNGLSTVPYEPITNSLALKISKPYNIKKVQLKYTFNDYKSSLEEKYVTFHENGMWKQIYNPDFPIDIEYFDYGLIKSYKSTDSFIDSYKDTISYVFTNGDTTFIKDHRQFSHNTYNYVNGKFDSYYKFAHERNIPAYMYSPRQSRYIPREGTRYENQIKINTKYFNRDSCDLYNKDYVLVNYKNEILQYEFVGHPNFGDDSYITRYKHDTIHGNIRWQFHAFKGHNFNYHDSDEIIHRRSIIIKSMQNGRVSINRKHKPIKLSLEKEAVNIREKWIWTDDNTMIQSFEIDNDSINFNPIWKNILKFNNGHLISIISKDSLEQIREQYMYAYDSSGYVQKLEMNINVVDSMDLKNAYSPQRKYFSPRNNILQDKIFQNTPECPVWPISPAGLNQVNNLFSGLNENSYMLNHFLGFKSPYKYLSPIHQLPINNIYKNTLERNDKGHNNRPKKLLSQRISHDKLRLLQNINGWMEYESDYPFFDVYDINPMHIRGGRIVKSTDLLNYAFDRHSKNNNGNTIQIKIEQQYKDGNYIFDFTRKLSGYIEKSTISFSKKGMPIKRVKFVNGIKLVETNFVTSRNRIMEFTSWGLLPNLSHFWYKTDGFPYINNKYHRSISKYKPDNQESFSSSCYNMSISFSKPLIESGCYIKAEDGLIKRVEFNLINEERGVPLYYSSQDISFNLRKKFKSVPCKPIQPKKPYKYINSFYPIDHIVEYEITKY